MSKASEEFLERMRAGRTPEQVRADNERRRERIERRGQELLKIAMPITEEVSAVWKPIESPADLVNTDEDYTVALPVLIKHLKLPYPTEIYEVLVRSMALKPFTAASGPILEKLVEFAGEEDIESRALVFACLLALSQNGNRAQVPTLDRLHERALLDDWEEEYEKARRSMLRRKPPASDSTG